jgi:hypothetical protein
MVKVYYLFTFLYILLELLFLSGFYDNGYDAGRRSLMPAIFKIVIFLILNIGYMFYVFNKKNQKDKFVHISFIICWVLLIIQLIC